MTTLFDKNETSWHTVYFNIMANIVIKVTETYFLLTHSNAKIVSWDFMWKTQLFLIPEIMSDSALPLF